MKKIVISVLLVVLLFCTGCKKKEISNIESQAEKQVEDSSVLSVEEKETIKLKKFNTIEQIDLENNGFAEMKDFVLFAKSLTEKQRNEIENISLTNNKFLKSLQGIGGFSNLRGLYIFEGTLLENLDGIEDNPSLRRIICSNIETLHDVSALANLPKLTYLSLMSPNITELPNLTNTYLTDLNIGKTKIYDILNLQIPDDLSSFGYAFMNVNTLYEVQNLFEYTTGIALYYNNITEIPDDIDFKKVERVYLGNNPIAKEYVEHDIRFIKKNGVTFMFGSPSSEQ